MNTNPHKKTLVSLTSDEIRHEANNSERILLGAMLRDCHLMPQVISGLNTVALTNRHVPYAEIFAEIIKQFQEKGRYSLRSIEQKSDQSLLWIASENTEVDLIWALEHWWAEYSKWATLYAYSAAVGFPKAADAMSMRANVTKAETELGLNWTQARNTAPEEFEQWGLDRIAGKQVRSNMRAHIRSMHEFIEFFEPGYVTAISGDTSMGKSQLAYNLFSSFCDQGAKGIFNSGEMPEIDGYKRLLGIRHGINPSPSVPWQEKDFSTIAAALKEVKSLPNPILKMFGFGEIEAACVAMQFNGGINFLFIDLLKYVTMPMPKGVSREETLSTITAAFITLAGRLKIHVFLVHHLNGDLAKRGGSKRPVLDDLRDSKAIKQDVANVIFCYRPAYYGIMEDEDGNSVMIRDERGNVIGDHAELIFAKNRNGSLGTAKVRWNPIRGYRDPTDYVPPPTFTRQEPLEDDPF